MVGNPGPAGASRRSAGKRSRSVGTRAPTPESGSCQPSSSPSFQRTPGKRAGDPGRVVRRVARGDQAHQSREVVRPSRRRQRPHVLEVEVGAISWIRQGRGGVRGVRELHVLGLHSFSHVSQHGVEAEDARDGRPHGQISARRIAAASAAKQRRALRREEALEPGHPPPRRPSPFPTAAGRRSRRGCRAPRRA